MKKKVVDESAEMQARLDQFIDAVDQELDHPHHHDASRHPHKADSFSWVEQEPETGKSRKMSSDNQHPHVHTAGHPSYFTSLLFTFIGSTSVVLLLLWLFWPAADDILERMPEIAARQPLALQPPSSDTSPASESAPAHTTTHQSPLAEQPAATATQYAEAGPSEEPGETSRSEAAAIDATAALKQQPEQPEKVTDSPGRMAAADAVQYATDKFLHVAVNIAIIRSSPVTGSVVARLKKRTRVRVTDREGEWFHLLFSDGRIGWGHKDLFAEAQALIDSEKSASTPLDHIIAPPPAATDVASTAITPPEARDQQGSTDQEETPIDSPSLQQQPVEPAAEAPPASDTAPAGEPEIAPTQSLETVRPSPETAATPATATDSTATQLDQPVLLPQGSYSPNKFLTVSADIAVMRQSPVTGKVISRLRKGTMVRVIGREGDWLRIRFPGGRIVWGHMKLFDTHDTAPESTTPASLVPAAQTDSSSTNNPADSTNPHIDVSKPRDIPVPAVTTANEKGADSADNTGHTTPAPVAEKSSETAATTEPLPTGRYSPHKFPVVTADIAVIRESPVDGNIVARLRKGTMVRAIGREGDWLHIRFPNGRLVWGHKDLFGPREEAESKAP
ncbi:hypothetical protein FEF65_04970 [Mariprofundus erugo]|uniref:SH3b domain-containing protein n=1 Tax=Mariprofundus erugo TaxID=2528639 RepID=A0A5R9GRT4_9PROT|nr:SH3 domain-containing protein [Mariprofundus erugo]TLS67805.1 hypothetical protein FEF65_04970 [Mariprofundus erugo]